VERTGSNLWQAYKQGLGLGLGVLTVYALALALLALLAGAALKPVGGGPQPGPEGGPRCSSSWV